MPKAAPHPCSRHPKVLLQPKQSCPLCPKPKHGWASDRERGNRHERGYGTDWNKLRKEILKRDNYICLLCRKNKASHVDHIKPKVLGGTDDKNNLQSLCKPCHEHKTATDHYVSRETIKR